MKSAFFEKNGATPIVPIQYTNREGFSTQFWLKRDDLIDPNVSGNKWRKLKFNIKHAITHNYQGVASFGGAFSNHIAALAAAGQRANLTTIGFIRCHEIDETNPTLRLAQQKGMKLIKLSREDYRLRHSPDFIKQLQLDYPDFYFVPEGGSNDMATLGLNELATRIKSETEFDYMATAIGSGGTIKGLMQALPKQNFIGVAAVKDTPLLHDLQEKFSDQLILNQSALFGGYAKFDATLEDFCLDFFEQTTVPIEPVYTGKLFYALCHQQELMALTPENKILAVHTGGLQGLLGLIYRRQIDPTRWQKVISSLAV